ncbi:ABC transporter permease [Amycolatopsis acidiphila]|nr:ABC transporter permease [Amycolatopsis acidiphila]
MLIPCALALLVIVFVPVVISFYLSFLKLDVSTLREWVHAPLVGFRNFADAFRSSNVLGVSALRSLGISVAFSLLTTLVVTPIGCLAAVSVHRRFRGRGLVRALYLVPYVIPTFVTALLARVLFLNQHGLVDRILADLGIADANTYWLIGPNAFWAMTVTDIWATWPFIYLMVLAGLQTIPREHYEAATLDGASPVRKLFTIVLPQIRGLLLLAILLSTLNHFGNFTLAYVMFSSPPPSSAASLPISTYFYAFTSFDYGLAAALAVITIILLMIPGYLYLRMTRIASRAE